LRCSDSAGETYRSSGGGAKRVVEWDYHIK
jgi:hypothetical protein